MADFYDPTSDVQTQWSSTGAAHYTEIDEGIRNPNQPTLTDYLSTNSNNAVDEWGFPAVMGSPPKIVAWLYAETQSKSTIVVSFQQGGVERATITIPINSAKKWYQCAWDAPSGDLSTLTIEAKQVKSGTGAGTYAYIYAAYLRAGPNLDKQVAASGDDGVRYTGTTGFLITAGAMDVGYNTWSGKYHCHVFARWTGVSIEGTIDVSYIECYANTTGLQTPELKVYGVDEDNPPAPTSAAEFDADPLTDAGVDWDGAWTIDLWAQSPSLNAIFQELINSYTISNEAVMVQIKNDHGTPGVTETNTMRAWDYDGNLHGPKLHIEYTPAGGAEYSIVAGGGSYAVAGTAASLPVGRVMGAGAGDYALAGAVAGLNRGLVIGAGAGSYALSGNAVGFPVDRVIGVGAGSYGLTGATVDLLRDILISAGAGTYDLTGSPVDFLYGKILVAGSGAYIISGSDALLPVSRLISAGPGSYSIAGSALSLLVDRIMAALADSYAITGTAVDLPLDRVMEALEGSYAITGQDVSLPIVRVITADGGSYVITGTAASLLRDLVMQAGEGTYLVFGYGATKGITMIAGAGSYLLSGTAVGFGEGVIPRLRTILGMGV